MKFYLEKVDEKSSARAGRIETAHGVIETPIFMPVGTVGSVKGIHFRELDNDVGAQIILGNTYHLYLRPGLEVIRQAGGLHRFIGWEKPILTDSGGYQVFSLAEMRKIKEEGVQFASHIDGSKHLFTPESVVDIQRVIGADIIMAFDECPPYPCDYKYAKKSMELTHRWLDRGIMHFKSSEPLYGFEQSFFPIVQGSVYKDLRQQSAEKIASTEMDGNAIGGLSVGEPAELMYEMIEIVNSILPVNKPRYLMGVGTPANILEAIALGVDMFDCVLPTRNGRNGMLFTPYGIMNMRNEKWKKDFRPIDENSDCYIDRVCSRAYLRHLFVAKEMLAAQIATIHNLHFYLWLVKEARKNIINNTFASWKKNMLLNLTKRL
ncbi:MAG: tRNA guanosine(34) transglycosylase Tgt [Bacteroidales bacterium]|nr:tRNA guanosine(34) transglycosylase Tgt [Bacteroidales bacterium]